MPQARLSGLFADRYLIEQELGHGATAVVYLALDKKHDRQIALKVLSKDLAHALGPQRFLREIHLTSRLHHPHILPIYDSGESNGLLYYVLPFVRGESLRERIDREKQLPMEECIRITCEVADALANAHAAGVIHRDVKPENIMISDGHALLSDFGIARTLDMHTGERLTSSGLIVGTSAYMSPEQASGEENIDARSDIYSLACVLYEMIAGVQPFIGPTTQAVIAQRFTHTPRPVSTYRPAVPQYVETVMEKALATAPADRYRSVKEFSSELSGEPAAKTAARDRRTSPLRRAVHGRQKMFGFAAVAVVVVSAAFVIANPPGRWTWGRFSSAFDSTKYLVVPSAQIGSATLQTADISAAAALSQTMAKFSGLTVVAPEVVQDAFSARRIMSSDDLLALAKKNGAGRIIRVSSSGDARLYDSESGQLIKAVTGEDSRRGRDIYSSAAFKLLAGTDWPKTADGGEGFTNSLPAWKAYGDAHALLSRGDFAEARKRFASAMASDPNFPSAQLWYAQLSVWAHPDSTAGWKELASKAAHHSPPLSGRDSLLAVALSSMAAEQYPDACSAYSRLTKIDQLDFAGWLGIGECNELDSLAVPDRSSPSGLSFRSGYATAFNAFVKAVAIMPAAYDLLQFPRIERILPVASNKTRGGHTASPGRMTVGAHPTLLNDTLAFVPFPLSEFATLPAIATLKRPEALKRDRQQLLAFASDWSQHSPRNPDALEALSRMLETSGNIADPGNGSPSAISSIRKARSMITDRNQGLRLAAAEVRLRFKLGDFGGAERLADSLLKGAPATGDPVIMTLLAALTGRASEMVHWAALAHIPSVAGSSTAIPPQLIGPAAEFFSRAALGICDARTNALETNIGQQLQSYVREEDRSAVRTAIEARSLGFLAPCTGGNSALRIGTSRDRLHRMQQAFANRNYAGVRAMLDTVRRVRKNMLPGEVSLDYTYQEAWLRAGMGDSLGAASTLDLSLNALPSLSITAIDEAAAAAAVGRALVFRADLAAKMGDASTARRHATALAALWSHADPELQNEVRRMRLLASAR